MNGCSKILILTGVGGGGTGGSETFVKELIKHLDKRKFSPLFCCLDYGGDITNILRKEISAMGYEFFAIPYRTGVKIDFRAVSQIKKIIRENDIDLIHSNGGYSTIAGIFSVFGSCVAIVETMHNDIISYSKMTKLFLGVFSHRLNKRVAVSRSISKTAKQSNFLISQKKVDEVVHNGVDLKDFSLSSSSMGALSETNKNFNFPGPVIGCVAKLMRRKGHQYLFEAMSKVVGDFSSATLILIGGGEEEDSLKRLAFKLGIENNVRFMGYQSNVYHWLKRFDFMVLPSLSELEGLPTEGLPISILEAFAMSKPVIATSVGGIPEVVQEGKNGFLVPPCDSNLLAKRIIYLLSNPELAEKMGVFGRAAVENDFDINITVRKYENIYLDAIKQIGK